MKYVYYGIALLVGVIGMYFGSNALTQEPVETNEEKCITIMITIEESNEYELCSSSQYLGEVVDENLELLGAGFTGNKTDTYGRLLHQLENVVVESNEFFFIYIDNVYGNYGVDMQIIEDGKVYEFRLQSY